MPRLAGVSRSSTVAWGASSQNATVLASGTKAGAISDSFDNTSMLELFAVDLTSSEMPLLGAFQTNERFHRLAWGNAGISDGSLPYGILAGGMEDGSIKIFNPALMIGDADADPLVATVEKHTGAVRGLEFNPTMSHLLASGAGDSEVYITDLSNPKSPSVFHPGVKPNQSADIACVAWNRKVAHILASTSHSGLSVVWDLKLKRPVISFADTNNRGQRNSVVAWNPDVATQILVAIEDDQSPKLQIWDLRNALAPVTELIGHHKGVLSASWCPNDSNLLVSAGKDNRTICWDPSRSEIVGELPSAGNWTFDVQWSPQLPAILASCSFDGEVSVFSLQDLPGADEVAVNGFAGHDQHAAPPRPMRAPKWLQRPCGGTFGFGGQVTFFNSASPGFVSIVNVATDHEVVSRAAQLQGALDSRDLSGLCASKIASASNERDVGEWQLMQVLCSQDQRQLLLGYLGLAEAQPAPQQLPAAAAQPVAAAAAPPANLSSEEDAAAIFSQLAVATEQQETMAAEAEAAAAEAAAAAAEAEAASGAVALEQLSPDAAEHVQGIAAAVAPPVAANDPTLNKAILNGNFEAAVARCISTGRMADALLLAASGGPELWVSTRDAYLASIQTPFMHTLSAIVHQDFSKYVSESELTSWKETLGLINTYASGEELPMLCNALANRLELELADIAAATLCYMCAANMGKTIDLWQAHYAGEGPDKTAALLDLMEKIIVFQEAADTKEGYPLVADKLAEFAELLASQGCLHEAIRYLLQLPFVDPNTPAGELLHRIHGCNEGLLAQPPAVPFELVHVGVAPTEYEVEQQQYYEQDQQVYPDGQSYSEQQAYPEQQQYNYQSQQYADAQYAQYAQSQTAYDATSQYQQYGQYQQEPVPAQPTAATVAQAVPATPTAYPAYAQVSQPAYSYAPAVPAAPPAAPVPPAAAPPAYAPPTGAYNYAPTTPAPYGVPHQQGYEYQATTSAPVAAPVPPSDPVPPPAPSYDPQPVIQIVQGLIAKCNAFNLLPIDKRKLDDVEKRTSALFSKLQTGEISAAVFERLLPMCQALAAGDARTAYDLHVQITTSDWADNGAWLMGMKRLIEMTQKLGVTL